MNDLFLRTCRRQPVDGTPIWMMRQAGRYLPEYREVRERVDFLTLCKTPELAAKVTLQPIDRFGFDAAILFADILLPAEAMGLKVAFNPGPVLDNPVREPADVERLRTTDVEETLPFVFDTIRLLRRELAGKVPLIGFAGAPFTLAAYLVEGQGSRNFERIKSMLVARPKLAHGLLEKITETTLRYLQCQIDAGAQALQLFDSWAGLLAPTEFSEFALRYVRRILGELRASGVPLIYFGMNCAHLLEQISDCGADVIGVDWRVPLDDASRRLGDRFALQGNLDPCDLFAPADVVARRTRQILERADGIPGHVFNLGHGVLPNTPIASVEAMVATVREHDRR